MTQMNKIIKELREIYREKPNNYVRKFDDALARFEYPIKDAGLVTSLISLLDDNAEHQELMFSIIHAAETSDDQIYSCGVIDALPNLWRSNSEWLQIIHVRILNSPATLNAYLQVLSCSAEEKRQIAKNVFLNIAARWPQVSQKAMDALSLIG